MTTLVSVIIPVYNDPQGIRDTLGALVLQSYPHDAYEIVVADNGSTDETPQTIKQFQEQYPDLIRLVVEDQIQSSYAARNKGIRNARGQIIAFIDADMWMDEEWLYKVANEMKNKNVHYMGCSVKICSEGRSWVELYDKTFGFPVENYLKKEHFAPTCCLVVKKTIFDIVGMFDSRLVSGGDAEFGNRVHDHGVELHFAPDIVVYHPPRNSLKSWGKKHFRIGRGHYQLLKYHPGRFRHLLHSMLDPRLYLPADPLRFLTSIKSCSEAERFTLPTALSFYFLRCCGKWLQTLGHLYQQCRQG